MWRACPARIAPGATSTAAPPNSARTRWSWRAAPGWRIWAMRPAPPPKRAGWRRRRGARPTAGARSPIAPEPVERRVELLGPVEIGAMPGTGQVDAGDVGVFLQAGKGPV